jgi:NADH:ubiquinone oxidoreductase subunit H
LANLNHIFFCLMGSLITFLFIWIRTSFPRLRYDQLMHLLWKRFLPLSIFLVMLVNSIIWAFNSALI